MLLPGFNQCKICYAYWDWSRANSEIHNTHTTTNTQSDFGSVLIKGRTKFEGSKNVP